MFSYLAIIILKNEIANDLMFSSNLNEIYRLRIIFLMRCTIESMTIIFKRYFKPWINEEVGYIITTVQVYL